MVRLRIALLFALTSLFAAGRAAADTVLLDFTQAGCGPCVEMEPVLAQLAASGQRIQHIDLPSQQQLAAQYRVQLTPTYIVLVDGREWARVTGTTKPAVMAEMIAKAQSLAAEEAVKRRRREPAAVTPVDFAANGTNSGATAATFASDAPMDGRVVPIQDPFAVRGPGSGPAQGAHGARLASHVTEVPAGNADVAHLIAATVRLSIADPQGKSTGTGTIVDTRNGMALVLTCGHLFRESQGRGEITISVFTAGPNGAEVRGEVQGVLIDYDLERDLALVRFETASPVDVTPIAPPGTLLLPGAPITSVGCNHGDNPTARSSNITTVNRYQGFPNVEIAGAPVEGRSGGGLFNAQGQIIGVCYAAEPEGDEGLFVALKSIHDKLDALDLAAVYRTPSVGTPPAQAVQIAANEAPGGIAVRGQDPGVPPSQSLGSTWPGVNDVAAAAGPIPTPAAAGPIAAPPATISMPRSADATAAAAAAVATLTPQERATLEEIASRSGGGEVICIIQPQSPEGRSDVIKLSGVSPAFVRALTQAAGDATVQVDGSAVPAMAAATSGHAVR